MHTLIKIVKGKSSEVPMLMWVVSAACVVYFLQDWLTRFF